MGGQHRYQEIGALPLSALAGSMGERGWWRGVEGRWMEASPREITAGARRAARQAEE